MNTINSNHGPIHSQCPGSGRPPVVQSPAMKCPGSSTASSTSISAPSSVPPPGHLAAHTRVSIKILKRIPRALCILAANKLTSILNRSTTKNDAKSWECLFSFPVRCLHTPKRGGHHHSLASEVNQLLKGEADPILPEVRVQGSRFSI